MSIERHALLQHGVRSLVILQNKLFRVLILL